MARTSTRTASESHVVEWKESWRDEYLRWLCGFANADGGTLVIGKNDKGEAVGASDAERLLVELPNKIRDTLGLVVPVRATTERGRTLVEIQVEPSPTPISYRGEYHFRSGTTKQQLTGNPLSAFLLRKLGRNWDSAPVPNVTVNNLSSVAFKRFKGYAQGSDRLPPGALALSRADLVEKLRLTESQMLKRAALLLFHEDPERWITGAYVKIGMFRSESDLLYHDEVHGDLFSQMDKTVELLLTKYMVAWISYRGLARLETFPIPRDALREAVLNALIHKDYGSGSPIQIRVYRDGLRISNAGELPPAWTAETLLETHDSRPPNPDIANTFFRAGLVEAWGRGYEKIREACREAGAPEPTVKAEGGITVSWKWPEPHDSQSTEVTTEVTAEVTTEVDRLMAALSGEMTRRELQTALGLKNDEHFRKAYLLPALEAGIIEMTIPDKPNSRLQKYRLAPTQRTPRARKASKK